MGATFSLARLSQFKNIYYIVSFFGSKTARQCQILVGGCADHWRSLNGRFSRLTSRLLEIGVCLFLAGTCPSTRNYNSLRLKPVGLAHPILRVCKSCN